MRPGAELRAATPDQGRDERRRSPHRSRFPRSRGAGEEPAHRARGGRRGGRVAASGRRTGPDSLLLLPPTFGRDARRLAGRDAGDRASASPRWSSSLDGQSQLSRTRPPYSAEVRLAGPPARAGGPRRGLRRGRRSGRRGPGRAQPGAGRLPGDDHRAQAGLKRAREQGRWRGPRSWCPRSGASRTSSSGQRRVSRPCTQPPGSTRSRCRPRAAPRLSHGHGAAGRRHRRPRTCASCARRTTWGRWRSTWSSCTPPPDGSGRPVHGLRRRTSRCWRGASRRSSPASSTWRPAAHARHRHRHLLLHGRLAGRGAARRGRLRCTT